MKIELLVKVVLHCSEYGEEEKIAIGTSNSQIQTSNSHISEGTIANCERADFLKIRTFMSIVRPVASRHAGRFTNSSRANTETGIIFLQQLCHGEL